MEEKKTAYTFEEFTEIVRELRAKCPWDSTQTHKSLKPCMQEEVEEVLEGIDLLEKTGEWDNLCEELGDVLLQVVLHSMIAQEEGLFTLDDVVDAIARKMIRRHPHIFGKSDLYKDYDGIPDWEEIKRLEREEKERQRVLRRNL